MADSPRKRTVRSAAGYMRPTMSSLAKKRLKFSVNAGRDPLPKSSKIPPKQSDRAEVQSKEVRLPDAGPISLDDQDVQIELRREESMGMGGPNSESYILDSRGAPVERKAVISRERLILGHCLVLSILVERATMLTVEDDEFWEGVAPVEFGDLPALQDAVTVMGYPIGGDTISITSGLVSQIEILSYFHGSTELLGLQDLIATAGADANAVVFDRPSGQVVSTLIDHSKKVTSVKVVVEGELVVTGSTDKTVSIWRRSKARDFDCKHILKDQTIEVQAHTIHASNSYFVSTSLDNTWCFFDRSSGLCLAQVNDTLGSAKGYTSAAFRPKKKRSKKEKKRRKKKKKRKKNKCKICFGR